MKSNTSLKSVSNLINDPHNTTTQYDFNGSGELHTFSEPVSFSDFYHFLNPKDVEDKRNMLKLFLEQIDKSFPVSFEKKDAQLLIMLLTSEDEKIKNDALSIMTLTVTDVARINIFTHLGGVKSCIKLLLDDNVDIRKKTLAILNQCLTEYTEQWNFIHSAGLDNVIEILSHWNSELSLSVVNLLQMLTYESKFQLPILEKNHCDRLIKHALYHSEAQLQQAILMLLMNLEAQAKTFFFQEDVLLFLKSLSSKATGMARVLSIKLLNRCRDILKKYQRASFISKTELTPYTDFILDINVLATLPGGRFVTGDREGMIVIWSLTSMLPEHILLSSSPVINIKSLPDNIRFSDVFVSAHANKTLSFWNFVSGECVRTITEEGLIKDLTLLSNGRLVVASECKYALKIMSRSYKISILDFRCFGLTPISVIGLSNEQLAVVNRYSQKMIEVWDTLSHKKVKPFPEQNEDICKVINLQNENIASLSIPGIIKFWEVVSRKCINTISASKDQRINDIQAIGDNEIIAASQKDIFIWNISTGLLVQTLQLPCKKALQKFIVVTAMTLLAHISEQGNSSIELMEVCPLPKSAPGDSTASLCGNQSCFYSSNQTSIANYQQSVYDYYTRANPSLSHRAYI